MPAHGVALEKAMAPLLSKFLRGMKLQHNPQDVSAIK